MKTNAAEQSLYPHLMPVVREIAAASNEHRINFIRRDRWIGYSRAQAAMAKLEELINWPAKQRMPNLLIIGPTGNGKSKIIKRFLERAEPRIQPTGMQVRSVLAVQMPPSASNAKLYISILRALEIPNVPHRQSLQTEPIVLDMLRLQEVRMLIIDEIQELLSCSARKQREVLSQLKYIGNQLQIPLVGVGTEMAWDAVKIDGQLANRFEPFMLPFWRLDGEFLALLRSFGQLLPLRYPSNMTDVGLAEQVLAQTDGSIGEITSLLEAAAIEAIRDGSEYLTTKSIAKAPYQSPSARRIVAAGVR